MKQTLSLRALSLSAALALLACSDAPRTDLPAYASTTPLPLEDALLYAADGTSRALTVDIAAPSEPVVHEHTLPAPSAAHLSRPGSAGREAIVLTRGREAERADGRLRAAEPSQILTVGRAGVGAGRVLHSRYGQLALSDEGRFAIAYGALGSLALQNAIEVVDLQKPAEDPSAAVVMDLTFDGRAPTRFVFAPVGFPRRLAVAPLSNALQVIDLEHPERGEISVTLGETRALDPQQIVFSGDRFFVRSSGSERIVMFQVVDVPRGEHPFQLAPSLLSASGAVNDLAVTLSAVGDAQRVLALGPRLDVIDPLTGETMSVERSNGFTRLHPFEGTSPVDDQVGRRALLYAPGRAQVGFVDLGAGTGWAGRSAELIELGEPIKELLPLALRKLAVATHGSARISVIDLQARTVRPITLDAPLVASFVDEVVSARLWIETAAGTLGVIELEAPFSATQLPFTVTTPLALSSGAGNLLIVPSLSRRHLAVLQASESGRVTLLDADQPSAESAVELVGFFLAGLFD